MSVCPSRYDARHRKRTRCIYVLNLGGTGIRPPDSFSYRSNFRFRSSFRSRSNFRSRSSSCSTTSGDIFNCSGSRQLNHSSFHFTGLILVIPVAGLPINSVKTLDETSFPETPKTKNGRSVRVYFHAAACVNY